MAHETHSTRPFGDGLVRAVWRRHKALVSLLFLASLSGAGSLVLAMPSLYRAEATILVEESGAGSSGPGDLEPRLQAIDEEIRSRGRLSELIGRFDLYPNLRRRASDEEVLKRMRRDVRVERRKVETRWGQGATVALAVGYQGWDPQTAARVANALADMIVKENERLRRREAVTKKAADPDVLGQLQRKLAELRARFNDRYPDVIRLEAEIAAVQRQRAGAARAPAVPSARAPRVEGAPQLRIIDPAVPPTVPSAPNRPRLLLMGLILAAGIAGAAAFVAEQFDTSFHRQDELWAFARLPILASIPHILTRGDIWRRRLRVVATGVAAAAGLMLLVRGCYLLGQASGQLVWALAQRTI